MLDHGYCAGEKPHGVSKHGHGKTGGLSAVSGGPTMNYLEKKKDLIGMTREHSHGINR